MVRRLVPLALALSLTGALGGCGEADDSTTASTVSTTTTTTSIADDSVPVEVPALGASVTASTAGEPGLVVQSVPDDVKTRLRVGDVIVTLNGAPVDSPQELIKKLGNPAIGDQFTIEVVRGSKRFTLSEVASPTAYLGAEIKDLPNGVGVVSVTPGGPAQEAGVKPGDVMTAIEDARTPTSEALLQAIATHAPGERVTLTVRRGSDTLELEATLVEHP